MNYVAGLWPGAGGVMRQGRWSFLMIALVYGFVLCGVVTVNFYWSELLTGMLRWGTYAMLGLLWLVLSGQSARYEKRCNHLRLPPPPNKDMFPDAQHHYLQGNWFEAECCLTMLLQKNPRDIEAMLMLATLYRHKERFDEAENLLRELERLEDAARWKFEIRSEKRKLIAANAKRSKKSVKAKPAGHSSEQAEAA
ncbi:MAG: hypothetical protein FWH27_03720 [Planctomycetaceae bacterium]|nr:hypothetical protein [Planctomycetaceae bacterium]